MSQELFGILNFHKPPEWTSRDVVNKVARLVRPAKTGHAGTLDPMATGVLLVCVGPATRLVSRLQEAPKTYRAEFELGKTSNTDDSSGEVTAMDHPPRVEAGDLLQLLPEFTGWIEQVPPQFSAVHVNGQRAYHLARQGEAVDLAPRPVEIHRLELLEFTCPRFTLEIECGSGTYIRSLGRDLGQRLGCGALMTSLVRTAIGGFTLDTAISPVELTREQLEAALQSPRLAVSDRPCHVCHPGETTAIRCGRAIELPESLRGIPETGEVALLDASQRLLALAEVTGGGQLAPRLVFPE